MTIEYLHKLLFNHFSAHGVHIGLGLNNGQFQVTLTIGGLLYLGSAEDLEAAVADALSDLTGSAFYKQWSKETQSSSEFSMSCYLRG
jgi:hypothetical protein